MTEAIATVPAAVLPDVDQALRFFGAMFGDARGWIHCRAVAEPKDGRNPTNHHYEYGSPDFASALGGFLDYCRAEQRAPFFLPGFVAPGGTGKADVLALPAICVDFDKDVETPSGWASPSTNLEAAERLLGSASLVVESGGRTERGNQKLHAYFRIPREEWNRVDEICRVREALAKTFGGDRAFKQAGQVIRICGGLHTKGAPKLVRLRSISGTTVSLSDADRFLGISKAAGNVVSFFDFNTAQPPTNDVERALVGGPILAEGASEVTRYEGAGSAVGHFIRMAAEGRYTREEAWQAAKDWAAATLVPQWDEATLRSTFERLWRIHEENHGAIAPTRQTPQEWARFDQWTADRFLAAPAPRNYLISDSLPLGVPAVLAAMGGVGKSFAAVDLAFRVATGAPASSFDLNNRTIFGGEVCAFGTAVVFAAEDDVATVHERLAALDPGMKRSEAKERLRVIPLPDAGGARALFAADRSEGYKPTAEFDAIKRWLLGFKPNIKLVVLDPLQTFVAADITAKPEAGQFVFSQLGALASELGATVLVTHHLKKAIVDGPESAREAIRGTTAIVDGCRWVYALWDCEKADGVCAEGAVVKANGKWDKSVHKYERLACGVLRQLPNAFDPRLKEARLEQLVSAVREAAKKGYPFTHTGPNGLFAQRHRLPAELQKAKKATLERWGQELLEAARIVKATGRGKASRNVLDVPEGDFAMGTGQAWSGAPP